jgi:hypothetical protein
MHPRSQRQQRQRPLANALVAFWVTSILLSCSSENDATPQDTTIDEGTGGAMAGGATTVAPSQGGSGGVLKPSQNTDRADAALPMDVSAVPDAPPSAAPDALASVSNCTTVTAPVRGLALRFTADSALTLQGGYVAAWKDTNGTEIVATQNNASQRPIVRNNALNGHAVVHFDGIDDSLSFPFLVTGKDKMTIAIVSRTWEYQRASENRDCDFDKDGLTDVGRELNCSGTDQSMLAWNEGGGAFASTGIFLGLGQTEATFRFGTGNAYRGYKTPYILEEPVKDRFVTFVATMDGYDRKININGAIPRGSPNYRDLKPLQTLATRADTDDQGKVHSDWPAAIQRTENTAWIARGRFDAPTGYWAGDVAEISIYNAALTDAERLALEASLRCRYLSMN